MMTLAIPSIQDLKKVSVKIICPGENNTGSGTLVGCNDTLYVLTAAHVICNEDKRLYDVKNIRVVASKDDTTYTFEVIDVPHFKPDKEKDCAVLVVKNNDGFPEEPLKQVRILKQYPKGNGLLCGFGGDSFLKTYIFRQVSDKVWALEGFDVAQQPLPAKENWGGFSGGGVFYKGEGIVAISSYMKRLGEIEGNNNEFVCYPAEWFAEFSPLQKIVLDVPVEYDSDDLQRSAKGETYFHTLDDSTLTDNHECKFIDDENLQKIIRKLKSDDNRAIMLTALSGLGKTRLIYESFKETLHKPLRYYCKFYDGGQALLGELKQLLQNGTGSEGVVIIDDCPVDLFGEAVVYRNMFNAGFRIIATNNDYFNIEDNKLYEVIRLEPSEIKDSVNQYIENTIKPDDRTRESVEEMKRLSDGFPQMAVALVDEFKKERRVSVDVVKDLMPKLLKFDSDQINNQKTIMQTLSLCLPLPYMGGQREAFQFMLSENLFTPLDGMDWSQRRSIAEKLVAKYKPTLIDVQSDWLYVRPFPLAVWLTAEWFSNVCNCNEHFKELIAKIVSQPEYIQNAISEGFCKHIEQMHGNKSAFALIEQLVDTEKQRPFFDEEVLSSGLGSKFFLAMSTVNPQAAVNCLASVFLPKDIDWLRYNFKGNARRNIVWALEKLCFASLSYPKASKVMARLAVAENESIANNATGQIKQLFHIYLAGTEVDLEERAETLQYLFDMGAEYAELAVSCCNNAFRSRDFTKTGGAERFGFTRLKDYEPRTYKEIHDYWNKCLSLLLNAIKNDSNYVDLVADLVVDNTFQWVRENRWNMLEPLLESVIEYKGQVWEKEYEALTRVRSITKKELPPDSITKLEQWITKLKPGTFITDLKEARQELWSNYKLKDVELLHYSIQLFEPLAEKFINQGVFTDKSEVDKILSDKDYIDNVFSKRIVKLMNERQLKEFFDLLFGLLMKKEENFSSPFLLNFCSAAVDTPAFNEFVEELRQKGRLLQYYNLMAFTEQEDLRHFKQLCSFHKKGELPDDFLSYFLGGARAIDRASYFKLVEEVHREFPDRSAELIGFVISHRFFLEKDEYCNEIVKQAVLDYEIGEQGADYEYYRLLVDILEQSKDVAFAKSLNQKMIELYNKHLGFHNSEGVFPALLENYLDDIWADFERAFVSPDYFLFYYQVKDELGSGYGFGIGPLFKIDNQRLRELCFKNPEVAPYRLASMAPCYNEDNDAFSDWFIWLLDNFGDRKDVRDSLHSNLGSFSWTGSTIPYYKRNISAFEKLLNHKRAEVREWAEKCLKDEKTMLAAETSNEDFMKIRYGMN